MFCLDWLGHAKTTLLQPDDVHWYSCWGQSNSDRRLLASVECRKTTRFLRLAWWLLCRGQPNVKSVSDHEVNASASRSIAADVKLVEMQTQNITEGNILEQAWSMSIGDWQFACIPNGFFVSKCSKTTCFSCVARMCCLRETMSWSNTMSLKPLKSEGNNLIYLLLGQMKA